MDEDEVQLEVIRSPVPGSGSASSASLGTCLTFRLKLRMPRWVIPVLQWVHGFWWFGWCPLQDVGDGCAEEVNDHGTTHDKSAPGPGEPTAGGLDNLLSSSQ